MFSFEEKKQHFFIFEICNLEAEQKIPLQGRPSTPKSQNHSPCDHKLHVSMHAGEVSFLTVTLNLL